MAQENVLVYRITSGDNTYPHSGNFTVGEAGQITVDDSNGSDDQVFGDFTHTGGADVPDQDVSASTVTGINPGDTVDLRYKYTVTGSDGSSGTVYFIATNSQANYGPLMVSDFQLDPAVTYTFGTFNTDGAANYDDLVPCFTPGTLIDTARGARPVERIRVGDGIRTLDRGMQPVRWIGHVTLDAARLTARPELVPVCIAPGALGRSVPRRALTVSPQHRILVRSRIAERMFGVTEVLVPARKLTGLGGVAVAPAAMGVTYIHLMFDRHEVIFAEGAATESLFAGHQVLNNIAPGALEELQALFPHIFAPDFVAEPARPFPDRAKRANRLVERHAANRQPVQVAMR